MYMYMRANKRGETENASHYVENIVYWKNSQKCCDRGVYV